MLVFVFSGHGNEGGLIYLQDGSAVSIDDQIITPFNLGQVFLFDACRGKEHSQTVEVPKGRSAKGVVNDSGGATTVMERLRVPEGSLVAYSTMPRYRAWDREGEGSTWLQTVAKRIKEDHTSSIEDVLTAVNKDLFEAGLENGQQPERLSKLNDLVFLHSGMDEGIHNYLHAVKLQSSDHTQEQKKW